MSGFDPLRTSADCASDRARARPQCLPVCASLTTKELVLSLGGKGAIERDGIKLNKGP
jgi:hypothetical protein